MLATVMSPLFAIANIPSDMLKQIENVGGKIDKIYYCPHLAESNCICRKPKPGMIQQAIKAMLKRVENHGTA